MENSDVLRTVQQDITVLVAESDDLDRRAFVHLLQHTSGLRLLGAATTMKDAVQEAVRLGPDVVLVDLERTEDALGTVAELRRQCPRVHCVVLTTAGDVAQLRRAVAAGTSGFVTKSVSVAELREVMLRVVAGERVLDPELSVQALLVEPCPLTLREGDILRVSRGCTTVAEIAATVSLTPGTVRNYLSRAISKTGARNRHEAAEEAGRRGWI
ncbi:response regulator transcription factor [Streptomyces sp. AC512_CC834]|uniref:response regulator transcription factor n=1 Tax=Streptomyces sp. AC512_CC834 TaxID=2823691 RepID=UPI001C275551|nr:response regulator transcription factor [Streptomyces sp. AC512_CC834]